MGKGGERMKIIKLWILIHKFILLFCAAFVTILWIFNVDEIIFFQSIVVLLLWQIYNNTTQSNLKEIEK